MYPLLTQVDGVEIQTHLCLCTYISSLPKSFFICLPRSYFKHCVSYPGTFRIAFGMFAQESWWVCNQKQVLHQALIAAVCVQAGRPNLSHSVHHSHYIFAYCWSGVLTDLLHSLLKSLGLVNASYCFDQHPFQVCHCIRELSQFYGNYSGHSGAFVLDYILI